MTRAAPKIVVLLSGGVDSAVAAARLVSCGHDVIGVHLLLGCAGGRGCGGPDSLEAARRTAREIGIPFFVVDLRADFERRVIRPFLRGRLVGRTRNPCIDCNARLRFDLAAAKLAPLGAEAFATGHYARVDAEGVLRRAVHAACDQSYVLAAVPPAHLRHWRFPLGDLTKDEVRREAQRWSLSSADRPSSQDLCFAVAGEIAELVERRYPHRCRSGEVTDRAGRVLAHHDGVHRFTVGQRRGIGPLPGGPGPRYVAELDPRRGRVVVAGRDETPRRLFEVRRAAWCLEDRPSAEPFSGTVLTRYRSRPASARVYPYRGRRALVVVDPPGVVAAPGQRAVWYRDDRVAGSGEIT